MYGIWIAVMKKGLFIGTSGWSYKDDWRDVFYHSLSSLLEQYLTYFDTVEINSTFYALPRKSFINHLVELPYSEKFFSAKLPKVVTHDNRLRLDGEGGTILETYFSLMKPLKEKTEALLIQLPPWAISTMGDLENFFSNLDLSFRYAIEFRHKSWLTERVWNLLEDYGIAHVIVDEPKLPINTRITTDFVYIRWHGHGTKPWYKYRYSEEELLEWKPILEDLETRSETVLGYFNNHFYGYAPLNGLQMLQYMGKINSHQKNKLERMTEYFSVEQTTLFDF